MGNWFVGLPVSPVGWFDVFRATLPRACRAMAPDDLHMTLAFLGPVTDPSAQIIPILQSIRAMPLLIGFDHLLGLPAQRPSALTLALGEGHTQAETLIREHRTQLLASVGLPPDPRPPLPHVTIARPIRSLGAEAFGAVLTWLREQPVPTQTVTLDRVALYCRAPETSTHRFQIVYAQPLCPERIN